MATVVLRSTEAHEFGNTSSQMITEIKQHLAWLVGTWMGDSCFSVD